MSVPTIGSQGQVISSLGAQSISGSPVESTGGSQKGFQYGYLVVNAGTTITAGGTCYLEESDTVGSGYTAVTGATMTFTASETGTKVGQVRLDGVKKFVRIVATGNGNVWSADLIGFPNRDTANYTPTSLEFDV